MTGPTPPVWGGILAGAKASMTAGPAEKPAAAIECVGCALARKQLAAETERLVAARAQVAELEAENTALRAAVNAKPPTDRAFADLERRMHRLADEEADLRGELFDVRNALQVALADLARAERTIANRDELLARVTP